MSEEQQSYESQLDALTGYIDTGDRYAGSREAGEIGEAVVGTWVNELADGHVVAQHDPGDAPQGIDTVYVDSSGELHAAESKAFGSGGWHQSQTSRTADGRQMDDAWVADRLGDIGVDASPADVGAEAGQVHKDLFQVDIPGDTFARYSVAPDGTRADNSPDEIYSLSDIMDLSDAEAADAGPEAESADAGEAG